MTDSKKNNTSSLEDGSLPIIAVTMGDPASIGPEIAVKALLQKKFMKCASR
jgi:4-hydroxy-L-threonine phosphate dehydrogenase PdxA